MHSRKELVELMELVNVATKAWVSEWNRNNREGITPAAAMVLRILAEEGPKQAKELIGVTLITSGGITAIADKLVNAGLIRRMRDEERDRRAVYLEITEQGREVLAVVNEMREQQAARFFAKLHDDDIAHLNRIFRKMVEEKP